MGPREQELVHLAMVEPGENCVETQYNGVDLSIPAGWGKELPKRGLLSLYYCREQECIDKVDQDGSWNQSNPPHTVNGKVPPSYKCAPVPWPVSCFCFADGMLRMWPPGAPSPSGFSRNSALQVLPQLFPLPSPYLPPT